MSLIPAFEIGLWNAWIFMLYHFLPMPLLMLIHKGLAKKVQEPNSEAEKKLYPVMWIIWLLALIYSIFLPLQIGTIWFYVGLPISIVGLITYTITIVTFSTTPIHSEPLTRELYRYSRHPMYTTQFVMFIGVGIASASWVFLLFSIVYTILSFLNAIPEERLCLENYGDAYRKYMGMTPRWIGIPKSGKK
jgi:protein-S-isoprenylcysteine O-methyltransferase Ste14